MNDSAKAFSESQVCDCVGFAPPGGWAPGMREANPHSTTIRPGVQFRVPSGCCELRAVVYTDHFWQPVKPGRLLLNLRDAPACERKICLQSGANSTNVVTGANLRRTNVRTRNARPSVRQSEMKSKLQRSLGAVASGHGTRGKAIRFFLVLSRRFRPSSLYKRTH